MSQRLSIWLEVSTGTPILHEYAPPGSYDDLSPVLKDSEAHIKIV